MKLLADFIRFDGESIAAIPIVIVVPTSGVTIMGVAIGALIAIVIIGPIAGIDMAMSALIDIALTAFAADFIE